MKYLLGFLLVGAGCSPNNVNLTIDRFVPALEANTCVVSPEQLDVAPTGLLDVSLVGTSGHGYVAFPVVTNHLAGSAPSRGPVEQNSIIFQGVNVELQPDATLAPLIPDAQRKFFVSAPANRLDPAGSVAVGLEIIPLALATSLAKAGLTGAPTVTAQVSPVGDYAGDKVIGGPMAFPIEICSFCLSGQPMACPAMGFPASTVKASCIISQDANTTCCTDTTSRLLCGAEVPMQTM
jgi:hypothetical protein